MKKLLYVLLFLLYVLWGLFAQDGLEEEPTINPLLLQPTENWENLELTLMESLNLSMSLQSEVLSLETALETSEKDLAQLAMDFSDSQNLLGKANLTIMNLEESTSILVEQNLNLEKQKNNNLILGIGIGSGGAVVIAVAAYFLINYFKLE